MRQLADQVQSHCVDGQEKERTFVSYEDSFEREAKDERAYDDAEHDYIFRNMRPANIGIWEWRLMFNRVERHNHVLDGMRDAKAMALELQRSAVVVYSTYYSAQPSDYKYRIISSRYEKCGWHFLKLLVIHGKYPLSEIRKAAGHGGSRHYHNEIVDRDKRWKQAYAALSDSEKLDFDNGPFKNPFPDGFWTSETYHAAPDAIASIEMTCAEH